MIEFTVLGRHQCLRLLAERTVGRVVLVEDGVPTAHPVNYLLDGEEIVFATASRPKVLAAAGRHVLGFEVDSIDSHTHSGWSVVGAGEAYEITAPMRLAALARTIGESWVPGSSGHTIAIPLRILHGRRLAPAGFVSDSLCGCPI